MDRKLCVTGCDRLDTKLAKTKALHVLELNNLVLFRYDRLGMTG